MIKYNPGTFEIFQPWYARDELGELDCVECDSIEKDYLQHAELRGIDVGHEIVQVFADPFEQQLCENGKDRARGGPGRRRMLACPSRRLKSKEE